MNPPTTLASAMPFFYSFTLALAANATSAAQQLVLAQDSAFDLYAFLAATDQDPMLKSDTVPIMPDNFSVLIQNQSGGNFFSLEPLRRSLICGTTAFYTLAEARAIRFPRKTQLSFVLNNLVAVPITVQFGLKGYKIFDSLP